MSRSIKVTSLLALAGLCAQAQGQPEFLVSDFSGNRVVRFKYPSGKAFDHFVGQGISPLDDAGYMAIGPDQKLYVSSYSTHSILRYDGVTGEFLGEFVTPGDGLGRPGQFAWGPDGHLYVCSWDNSSVLMYNGQSGVFKKIFISKGKGGLDGAWGLVFEDDGNLLVASSENDKVLRFDSGGNFVKEIPVAHTGLNQPRRLIRDSAGTVYVTGLSSDSVIAIDAQDSARVFVSGGLGGLDQPSGMAFDPDGNLLVCSMGGDGTVLKYDGSFGQYLGYIIVGTDGGMSGNPSDILFLPQPEECGPDYDGNGLLDLFDFLAFVNAFNAGC